MGEYNFGFGANECSNAMGISAMRWSVYVIVSFCLGLFANASCTDSSSWIFRDGTILQRDLTDQDNKAPNLVLTNETGACRTSFFSLDGAELRPAGTTLQDLTVGTKVRVWFDSVINESCPINTSALKIEVSVD